MSRIPTQKKNILNHILIFGSITPLEALNRYGCFRLASVIFNLKKEGHDIITNIIDVNGKSFAQYHIRKIEKE